jgi:two-component system phosphate regulon response regulator PhoB
MQRNKILMIDDNEAVGSYLYHYLNNAGFEITVAGSYGAALQIIHQDRPDLLMLTGQFTEGNRLEIVRVIRDDPALYQLPIIVTGTAYDPSEVIGILESGADEYLIRSMKPSELIARVRAVLRRCYPQDYQVEQQIAVAETDLFNPVNALALRDSNPASDLKINFLLIGSVLVGAALIAGLILWLIF